MRFTMLLRAKNKEDLSCHKIVNWPTLPRAGESIHTAAPGYFGLDETKVTEITHHINGCMGKEKGSNIWVEVETHSSGVKEMLSKEHKHLGWKKGIPLANP